MTEWGVDAGILHLVIRHSGLIRHSGFALIFFLTLSTMTKANPPQILTAGPIRLKYQDGELRYLRVGDRELVRRIYFGVRDATFQTYMPVINHVEVNAQAD